MGALGSQGLKSVLRNSPTLARLSPELCQASSLNSIDVISVRLWLDKTVVTRSPANVLSRFKGLQGAGGTFFMLDQLQDKKYLWNADSTDSIDSLGSVVACDFYNAGALISLSDEDIVNLLIEELLPDAVPDFRLCKVVDCCVLKLPSSVTWFSPGSYLKRPPLTIDKSNITTMNKRNTKTKIDISDVSNDSCGNGISNLACAGDWVRMGSEEFGAKGLCQERAYVSGIKAANRLLSNDLVIERSQNKDSLVSLHSVIELRDDEIQVKLGRELNRRIQAPLKKFGLDSFWL